MKNFIILAFFVSACSVDRSNEISLEKEEMTTPAGLTVVFESDTEEPYTISRDQTFKERLQGIPSMDTLAMKRDTVLFPLDEDVQLVYGRTPLKFDNKTFLGKKGDTIHIQIRNNDVDIYKISRNKREEVLWFDTLILSDNSLFREKEKLKSVFITAQPAGELVFLMPNFERKDEWNALLKDYTKVIDRYYGSLLDSLNPMAGPENALYHHILQRKQFFELSSLNDVVNDPELSDELKSSKYINLSNFHNRYLNSVIGSYFHKNYAYNKNISLAVAYEEGFIGYPQEMRRSFKAQAISSMIVKKYDRDMILKYANAYKEEFGAVTPLEAILEEIEYGAVADHDLILQDYLGKEIKWEELRKQWVGKLIYVDFWASWCAPCLRVIPFSKELKEQLKHQEVVFVYLAINDQEKAWKKMSQKHQIEENNYLILNSRSSKFVTQTRLEAIPRYMIYDKNGQLVHQDAPGPDQKEAYEVLTSYLQNH